MNFDLENVRPFLDQVESNLALGLDIDKLVQLTENTEVENLGGSAFQVDYLGVKEDVRFACFMDDFDAPDLYFHVSNARLAEQIDEEMSKFCEANGL